MLVRDEGCPNTEIQRSIERVECEAEPFEPPRSSPSHQTPRPWIVGSLILVVLAVAFAAATLVGVSLLAVAKALMRSPLGRR